MNKRARFIFLLISCLMPLAMVAQQTHWTPQGSAYEDNMTLTGVIQINGVEQQSANLEVGAFCGTECRGAVRAVLFPATQRYVVMLTIFGNDGDQITFRLYDHNQGMELNYQSPAAVTFGSNSLGSLMNPYVLNFTSVMYTISASANPSTGGMVSGAGSYPQGANCTLTATANTGYTFVRWTRNGTQVSTSPTYSFTVTENASYVAVFNLDSYTISASASPSSGGTVSGAGSYNYGSTCFLAATPNMGYTFVRWTKNGTQVSTNPNYSFTVAGAASYVAVFSLNSYTVLASASPSSGGTVSGAGSYYYGSTCTLSATANTGYTFDNWTENGTVVSATATYSFEVTDNRTLVANFVDASGTGILCGMFTVSEQSYIRFSKGNLQYQASTNTWRFATNQYDIIGDDNSNISETYSGWIDLFNWGTSGYDHGAVCFQPWSTSNTNSDYYAYGHENYNLYDQTGQADWGYNAISNGGNQTNKWRTLTHEEWAYVLNTRSTISGIRYAKALVDSVNGLILLPDDWSASYYSLDSTNMSEASYSCNVISASAWISSLEQHGAVFLPAAGYSWQTLLYYSGSSGCYWSTSCSGSDKAYLMHFNDGYLHTESSYNRPRGLSVRLVCPDNYSFSINASASPEEGGMVSGMGEYDYNTTCTLTAMANEGYAFMYWTENGQQVSTNPHYSFNVIANRDLVAHFTPPLTISATASPVEGGAVSGANSYNYGSTCTLTAMANTGYTFDNWTENGTVVSATATYSFEVTDNRTLVANFVDASGTGILCGVFTVSEHSYAQFSKGNLQYQASTNTWRFATDQYDFIGDDNSNISENYSGWIDLFGWGTSGYDHGAVCYQPWRISQTNSDYYAYGQENYNLYDQTGQADWGYNAICNGGNQMDFWRTLSNEEWNYVLNERNTISGIRYAKAQVNGINGLILLPDDWSESYYKLNSANIPNVYYFTNFMSAQEWKTLEQHGAVFLPAAGQRVGTSFDGGSILTNPGLYWSASYGNSNQAFRLTFTGSNLYLSRISRSYGLSVRLAHVAESSSMDINISPSPADGGTVNGGGTYYEYSTCTLTATPNSGYIFDNWTENGIVVSSAPTYTFLVTSNRTLVANFADVSGTGKLNGVFSVGEHSHVHFSQGNLQYQASNNIWRFATKQYDYIGSENCNISETYNGWIDLFGWGTSGYDHGAVCYQPWSSSKTNKDYLAYGQDTCNLYDQTGQADWGYNAICNGGNQTNLWRTLTREEWAFVFNARSTTSGIRYAKAQVAGMDGIILLPDDWNASYYDLNSTNTPNASYNSNVISSSSWTSSLEQHGAVFLPAAGFRSGTSLSNVENIGFGHYMSSSFFDRIYVSSVIFTSNNLNINRKDARYSGQSVRLVCPAQISYFDINVSPNPAEGGTVSGAGTYEEGTTCTLTATSAEDYIFVNWTENGEVVSTEETYSFTVTGTRELMANFILANPIIPTNGMIAYYPFNGNANDASGYGNHGILQGNAPQLTSDRFGNENSAYLFGGYYNKGWIRVPNSSSLALDDAMSISFWVNFTDFGGQNGYGSYTTNNSVHAVVCKGGDNYSHPGFNACFSPRGDSLMVWSFNRYPDFYYVDTYYHGYEPGQWLHCVVTVGNTLAQLYINGVLCQQSTYENADFSNANNQDMTIGVMNAGSWYPFNGKIDDVILYNRALSSQEVAMLYNFVESNVTQTIELSQGWTWMTSTVHTSIEAIQASLGNNLQFIQSNDGTPGGNIVPCEMYRIQTTAPCTLTLTGAPITSATVTINSGENWFGFVGTDKAVGEVFDASFGPAKGDKIISQDGGFAIFEDGGWCGTLGTLQPGKGYVYVSNDATPKTLVIGE